MWTGLNINLQPRPSGFDVSDSIYRARVEGPDGLLRLTRRPLPTAQLAQPRMNSGLKESEHTISFGMVNQMIENRLKLGVSATLPVSVFQSQQPFFIDEREQYFSNSLHFELFEDRLRLMAVSVGLGLAISQHIHFGLGASLINHAQTSPHIYIPDAADQSRTETNAEVEITSAFSPHFGLVIKPLKSDALVLTSTAHLAAGNRVEGGGELQFWNYEYPEGEQSIEQQFEHQYGYEPLRISAGIRSTVEPETASLKLTGHLNVLWSEWSTYINRQAEGAQDWQNTVSLDGGIRMTQNNRSLQLGFLYAPTPVPPQEGQTNYVDNSRIGSSLGLTQTWKMGKQSLSITLSTSVQILLERSHFKREDDDQPVVDEVPESVDLNTRETIADSLGLQTNNPGFPGYSSHGFFALTGINLKWVK